MLGGKKSVHGVWHVANTMKASNYPTREHFVSVNVVAFKVSKPVSLEVH